MDALSSAVVLLTSFLFISTLPRCRPLSFSYNFSDPATFDRSNITTEGTATISQLDDDGLIELTQNPDPKAEGIFNRIGRASYSKPVLLWDKATGEVTSFTTRFSFAIKASGGTQGRYGSGDGIAFFLSPYPSKMPPKDAGGGYLGLFVSKSTAATPVVVAVEFDTYQNEWDPSTNHIGIDVNSINSTAVEVLPDGKLANCSEPMIALVSYNSSTRLLAVALQLDIIDGGMRYEMNSTVDLRSLLPAEVAIGFSAASGWSIDLHRVLTWSFNSTLVETKSVPVVLEEPKGDEGAPNKAVKTFPSKGMVLPVAGAAIGAVLTVACVGVLIWFLMMRSRRRASREPEHEMEDLEVCSMDDEFESGTGPRRFRYGELAAATNHFSEDGKLGEGGFGRPRLLGDESIKSSLLEWVWDLYGRGAALDAADRRLDGDFDDTQMQRVPVVGLWCAHPDRGARPSIKQALAVLQSEAPLPGLPPKMPVPTYTTSVAGYATPNYQGLAAAAADAAGSSSSGDSSSVGVSSSTGIELSTTTTSSSTTG
ncbi:hypothetical protein ACQ4PT_021816 [Festuca glaucescens]